MNTVSFQKEAPIRYSADVIVVGGGTAGVGAAVAAGREGKSVILIEHTGCLGGMATNGHVSPFDATKDRKGNPFGGIAEDIIQGMNKAQLAYGVDSAMKREGPHLFKWVLLNLCLEANVDIIFNATLVDIVREGDEIKYAIINTKSGIEAVSGKMFIDATGDGDVFYRAGEEFIIGSEANANEELNKVGMNRMHFEEGEEGDVEEQPESSAATGAATVQPCSIMFTMGNVDNSKNPLQYNNKLLKFEDLGIDKEEFKKLPYYGTVGFEDNGDLIPLPQGRILLSHTGRPKEMLVNMSRIIGVDSTDARQLTDANIKAQLQVMYLVDFLKRYVPGFENSYLVESGNVLGIRESRRLIGRYVLKGSEAALCEIPEDTVACGSYMIDIHDPHGKRKAIGGNLQGSCYGIPYRCLTPKTVKNLLVCGRCISVDHISHASTRIQGTCVITGQAAGTAAAIAISDNVSVQDVEVKKLQNTLESNGMYLGR